MPTIFYSWQADHPSKNCRNFLRSALEEAIRAINSDAGVENASRDSDGSVDDLLLDSDTSGVPGSPPIAETIFRKIDEASAFLADLTFVGQRIDGRPTPNPNVLLEYGYALKSRSYSRVIAVMNEAYGNPTRENLPFDLGHMRRPITYNLPEDANDVQRKAEKKKLITSLKVAITAILQNEPSKREDQVPFDSVKAAQGRSRFRAEGEPLGIVHDGSPIPRPEVSVSLRDGPCMWLRVMPKFGQRPQLQVTTIRNSIFSSGRLIAPLNFEDGMNFRGVRGPDGYGLYAAAGSENPAVAVAYVFRSGEIWSIDTYKIEFGEQRLFFSPKSFSVALAQFAQLLSSLGVAGPYSWQAGLEGIRQRRLYLEGRSYQFEPQSILVNEVCVEGEFDGNPELAHQALLPFFAELADAGQQSI